MPKAPGGRPVSARLRLAAPIDALPEATRVAATPLEFGAAVQ